VEELLQSAYDFIGRGVLQCEATHAARTEELRGLGFRTPPPPAFLTLDQLMLLFMGIGISMGIGIGILAPLIQGQPPKDPAQVALLSAMIATMYALAVWIAIVPKDRWTFARPRTDGFRPVFFYFVAGVFTVIAGIPINYATKVIQLGQFDEAWLVFRQTYPWLVMSFTTAFVTALLADNRPTAKWPCDRLRWIEGGIQSILTMGAAALTYGWLQSTMLKPPTPGGPSSRSCPSPLVSAS